MKINILYNFQKGPWGGGNQFLKAVKKEFIRLGVYEEDCKSADVILFNSYPFRAEHFFDEVLKLKQGYPEKIVVYRLNGPISFIRNRDVVIDKIISLFNKILVDGIIFQSRWCKGVNKRNFNTCSKFETVIYNAPDNAIFNKSGKREFSYDKKVKLIATSWSSNHRKGFDIYKYLDENLDFNKYEMTFVGNSPIKFKNIKIIESVPSEKLAEIVKQNDIFITASKTDPCSNSLIEALSCGLPAVALADGGPPELVDGGGEIFDGEKDVLEKIDLVTRNYDYYRSRIPDFSIEKVAKEYYDFAKEIYNNAQNGSYVPKKVDWFVKRNFYKMKSIIFAWKVKSKLKSFYH